MLPCCLLTPNSYVLPKTEVTCLVHAREEMVSGLSAGYGGINFDHTVVIAQHSSCLEI